jgi:hypothetical protein
MRRERYQPIDKRQRVSGAIRPLCDAGHGVHARFSFSPERASSAAKNFFD